MASRRSGGLSESFPLALLDMDHAEVAIGFQPILMDLDGHRRRQLPPLGNTLTTWVRHLISWLTRSNMLVDFRCL